MAASKKRSSRKPRRKPRKGSKKKSPSLLRQRVPRGADRSQRAPRRPTPHRSGRGRRRGRHS